MSRLGYLILVVVIITASIYLFWPAAVTLAGDPVLTVPVPTRYEVVTPICRQQVDGDILVLDGRYQRQVDPAAAGMFWTLLGTLRSTEVKEGIGPDQLAAFGITGAFSLTAAGLDLRWGLKDMTTYVWVAGQRRIFALPKQVFQSLTTRAMRLDHKTLLSISDQLDGLQVDTLELRREQGTWLTGDPNRPQYTGRAMELLRRLSLQEMNDLKLETPPADQTVHRVILFIPLRPVIDIRYHAVEHDGGLLVVAGLPPQRIDPGAWQQWQEMFDRFAHDRLFDNNDLLARDVFDRISIRSGANAFSLQREDRSQGNPDGPIRWEVIWSGGREAAEPDLGLRFEELFVDLAVTDTITSDALPDGPDTVVIAATSNYFKGAMTLRVAGNRAGNGRHVGSLVSRPALLDRLDPDALLDPILLGIDPARIVKFQRTRRTGDDLQAEVYLGSGTGGWTRTHPDAGSGDRLAVTQVLRALCQARAIRTRRATKADRAVLAHPERSFAVRLEPVAWTNEEQTSDIDASGEREWAIALARQGDAWLAVHLDGYRAYVLSDEVVQELFAQLRDRLVYPIIPSMVVRLQVHRRNEEPYVLVPVDDAGTAWRVEWSGGTAAAEALQVRRYLHHLAGLTAERVEEKGIGLDKRDAVGEIVVVLPGVGRAQENLRLLIGTAVDGLVPVSVSTSSQDTGGFPPRVQIRADGDFELCPPRERFLLPADLRRDP